MYIWDLFYSQSMWIQLLNLVFLLLHSLYLSIRVLQSGAQCALHIFDKWKFYNMNKMCICMTLKKSPEISNI